jgi:hypothetical protein
MMARLDAHHERMMTRMDSEPEKIEATVDVFEGRLNKMDTILLEASRDKMGCSGAAGCS